MSGSVLSNTIEMTLTGKPLARLVLEQCELIIGSEYGVILQPLQEIEKGLASVINGGFESIAEERKLIITTAQQWVKQKRWTEVIQLVRSTEQAFAIANSWEAWEQVLNWGLKAAWALQDEVTEAWALHQLGTLAFCQEQVTLGYDLLKEALDLRSRLGEGVAIAFSQHNLSQLKALIVPMEY
jgi:hypothetical protein